MIKNAIEYTEFVAKHSNDPKQKVGCVIFQCSTAEVIAQGYNGNPEPMSQERDSLESGKSGFLHAEIRCAIACKEPRTVKKEVYVTLQPCLPCAKALLDLGGVCKLYYKEQEGYSLAGIDLLKSFGISCVKYES